MDIVEANADPVPPRYTTRAAIDRLNLRLQLSPDKYCQDWEIELADSLRVEEFVDIYETESLDDDERFALMALIVASFEDVLSENPEKQDCWPRISQALHSQFDLHSYTVSYWAAPGADLKDGCFSITPLMREVWAACQT